jgi:hypothetical protein
VTYHCENALYHADVDFGNEILSLDGAENGGSAAMSQIPPKWGMRRSSSIPETEHLAHIKNQTSEDSPVNLVAGRDGNFAGQQKVEHSSG